MKKSGVEIDDLGEIGRFQAGAAHQRAVDVRLGHEFGHVVGLDGAAVEDAGVVGRDLVKAV